MASVLSAEAYLPCLLDRLTDDNPETTKEINYYQSYTMQNYRRGVLRDLRWLLNAPCHSQGDSLEAFPAVLDSVINFGTPDLTGRTSSSLNTVELEAQVKLSILRFEPRILAETLVVKLIPNVNKVSPNIIGFEISGVMWANPMSEQFLLKTQLDLETGRTEF
jgi:type VI secretion system protein ImpF